MYAPFHPKLMLNLTIEPKMSFGTGHHETTHMMIQHLLETEVTGMKTLDMGCGTAILAILAEMTLSQSTLSTLITGVI
jgi:ribosomal protein L11 methyltransferase